MSITRAVTGSILKTGTVGPRQIRVIASDATPDLAGDILEPWGARLDDYRANPVVLESHKSDALPIARCSQIGVEGGKLVATFDFPDAGISERADECLRLVKAGILRGVSVGFLGISSEPQGGGRRYTEWTLLEISLVSIPCNPSALVTEKAMNMHNTRHNPASHRDIAALAEAGAQARKNIAARLKAEIADKTAGIEQRAEAANALRARAAKAEFLDSLKTPAERAAYARQYVLGLRKAGKIGLRYDLVMGGGL